MSWFILPLIMFSLTACSTLVQKIYPVSREDPSEASEKLLSTLTRKNDSLASFKGTGKIKIRKNGSVYSSRVAWIGAAPERLRMEIMGSPGLPKFGFSSDGEWFYYYDPNDKTQPVKRIPSNDPSLNRFASVSITSRDVISILSGRIPHYDHWSLKLKKRQGSGGYILIRYKKWRWGSQRIFLAADRQAVEKIEVQNGGTLVYRVEFKGYRMVDSYLIPKGLIISNNSGNRLQLDIEKYWVNARPAPDAFILSPP